jgi:hypothetical protein
VAFARAYVVSVACAHVEVNGRVPLPDLRGICPWPVNTKGVRYMTHDITDLLVPGRNALGMIAGHQPFTTMRWHSPPKILALVAVHFAGERTPTFVLSTGSPGWVGAEPYVTTSSPWDATIDCERAPATLPPLHAVDIACGAGCSAPRPALSTIRQHRSGLHMPVFLADGCAGVLMDVCHPAMAGTRQDTGWSFAGFRPGPEWSAFTASPTGGPGSGSEVSARALAMPLSTVVSRAQTVAPLN